MFQRSLKLSSFKKFFLIFFLLFWLGDFYYRVFHIADCSSISFNLLLILFSIFFISVLVVFLKVYCFLYFLSLFWMSYWIPPFFSPVWLASLWLFLWTLYLFFFFFSPFSEVLCCLFIWKELISSSFCLTFCVSFYVLGTSAISPSFERMTFCRKCFVGPSGAIPLVTGARCSRGYPLCGFCVPAGLFVAGALMGMVFSQSSGWENLLWL